MKIFKPGMYYRDIFSIDYDVLKKKGIKVLIFDSDNTIITYDDVLPNEKVLKLFQKLSVDFKIFLVAESDLAELRKLYGGRKDIITPSVFSRLSPERQQQVMDEMLAEARRAGIRRTKLYQKLAKEMH